MLIAGGCALRMIKAQITIPADPDEGILSRSRLEMSVTTTILALVLYPLLSSLPFNPVRFRWGFSQGLAPMPPEVQERAEAADRTVLLLIYVTLLTVGAVLLHGSSISVDTVGLNANNWKSAIALGVFMSFLSVGIVGLMPPGELRKGLEARGSLAMWCGLRALEAFSVEFWRALCIVALIRLDLSAGIAVLITVLAYQAPRLITNTPTAAGAAVFGAVTGFLFVKTGSLLAPLTMSLITGGTYIYRTRHAPSRSVTCPFCRAHFYPGEVRRTGRFFTCPQCDELLECAPPGEAFSYVWFPLCLYGIPILSYYIGYRDFTSLVVSIGAAFLIFFFGIVIHNLVIPPKAQQRLSYGDSGLHLTSESPRPKNDRSDDDKNL